MTTEARTAVRCDGRRDPYCHRSFEAPGGARDVRTAARTAGWTRSIAPAIDLCPACGHVTRRTYVLGGR